MVTGRGGLGWSGIGSDSFSLPLYKKMLMTYVENGEPLEPDHLAAALYSVYGSMINWVQFNITITDKAGLPNSKKTAHQEITAALERIKKINQFFCDLVNMQRPSTQ